MVIWFNAFGVIVTPSAYILTIKLYTPTCLGPKKQYPPQAVNHTAKRRQTQATISALGVKPYNHSINIQFYIFSAVQVFEKQ